MTCYFCVNVSNNYMCNRFAIDVPCPTGIITIYLTKFSILIECRVAEWLALRTVMRRYPSSIPGRVKTFFQRISNSRIIISSILNSIKFFKVEIFFLLNFSGWRPWWWWTKARIKKLIKGVAMGLGLITRIGYKEGDVGNVENEEANKMRRIRKLIFFHV